MAVQDRYTIQGEKLEQAVALMKERDIDSWLILTRENSDPSLPLLVGVPSVHQGAIFINANGEHVVLTTVSDQGSYEETGHFKVIPYYANMEDTFKEYFATLSPRRLALNMSQEDHMADGLSRGLYLWLEDTLGKDTLGKIAMSSEDLLQTVRSIKSPAELEHIQKAIDITQAIYREVFSTIQVGMTEREVGQLFVKGLEAHGVTNGIGGSFSMPIVCIVRCGLAHRQPGDHEIQPGDMLIMDFSVRYKGYVSDIARTAYFLKPHEETPPQEVQRAFDTAVEAVSTAIGALQPGIRGYEVDAAGRKVIEDAGYPTIRHSTGHQIGQACHDGGTILGPRREPPRKAVEREVLVGEVYAVEPTVIQDGGLPCVIVEENVLVTPQGPRILSERQTELITISSAKP